MLLSPRPNTKKPSRYVAIKNNYHSGFHRKKLLISKCDDHLFKYKLHLLTLIIFFLKNINFSTTPL